MDHNRLDVLHHEDDPEIESWLDAAWSISATEASDVAEYLSLRISKLTAKMAHYVAVLGTQLEGTQDDIRDDVDQIEETGSLFFGTVRRLRTCHSERLIRPLLEMAGDIVNLKTQHEIFQDRSIDED